ncbi:threonine aldolase family protein [Bdellovibrio bacteriovorus]|uniref:Low specificity L-threonine aldolase protein n=1 Tax=Bdellovibrio bacteriovorus str. Tiberius TaxID=1069642 RepID=K7ZFG9_BDEBC|nr:low specificity L-threonine aldolase [Bdellovibrio bacteriovorus]AFY01477.1 low specificity L-threonine aldolase protein [Bdellovibrio bacteriovorus str. Tiberius]
MKRGFGSDNHAGVHPRILQSILDANIEHAPAYGTDEWTERAVAEFKNQFGKDAHVFFVFNGTAANVTALRAMARPWQSVFCSDVAHINVDECGSPEFLSGCKLLPLPSHNGKLSVEELEKAFIRRGDQHFSQTQVLSLTQPTELGTTYSAQELKSLIAWAKSKKLLVHIDGARLGNAALYLKKTLKEITTDLGVDVVSFGGTKNGLMMGEAVVILNKDLAQDFKYIRKQSAQLPSKTRFIACQFEAYFKEGLWQQIADHSHQMALYLYEQCKGLAGVTVREIPQSNAVFATIPSHWVKPLREKYFFYVWDENTFECRWMTSWDTQKSDIDGFVALLKEQRL